LSDARDIFRRSRRLTPGQLRAVADRRFDDAMCLLESGETARANGAMYMGGIAVECLLKALLLERHPNLAGPVDPARLSKPDREVYTLLFSHALEEMLLFLPDVRRKLGLLTETGKRPIWPRLKMICGEWSIFIRYSPKLASRSDAREFLNTIAEARQWLKTQ